MYLDLNRSIDELYFEKYDNVAVMFASLTDYKLGVEDDAELNDKFFLSILDQVISDFDRVSKYVHYDRANGLYLKRKRLTTYVDKITRCNDIIPFFAIVNGFIAI